MKIRLKRSSNGQVQITSPFQVKKLLCEGVDLERDLIYYLSKFTKGTMDPDIADKKPDKFVVNLLNCVLGDFSKRYIITAHDNNEVIGILIGLPKQGQLLHIYALHVAPEYRNKGVGTDMLSRCINDMRNNNVKDITIDVHIDNKPAYNLYTKFDFMEMELNKDY